MKKQIGKIFKIVIWTDFGVPSSKLFGTEQAARTYGECSIRELGCVRYTITEVAA